MRGIKSLKDAARNTIQSTRDVSAPQYSGSSSSAARSPTGGWFKSATYESFASRKEPLTPAQRHARTVSFLKLPEAEEISCCNKIMIVILMCLAASAEGMDGALFPATTQALLNLEDFDVKNLGYLSSAQSLVQAFSGPVWGILGSRAILRRRDILAIGAALQGLATVLMCFFLNVYVMTPLRGLNGFALAALRPVANSVIADTFDDRIRGKMFGLVQMSMMLGSGAAGWAATKFSEVQYPSLGGIYGWKLSFIVVGTFTGLMGPVIFALLQEPLVKPDPSAGGVQKELRTLLKLMSKYTFAACVFQGCFGLIPWKAFEFRTFFFQQSGISNDNAGMLNTLGMFAAAAGTFLGGVVGDVLSFVCGCHGRIACAEISVFGGIPIAYFMFLQTPSEETAYNYYLMLVVVLGLVATWTPAGANSPILCSIASESERTLILAWQVSLEGAIGSLGPLIFTFLLSGVFGFDPACAKDNPPADCDNAGAAGQALFWTSCFPWLICGLIYTSMHLSYPRDLERTFAEIQAQNGGQESSVEGGPAGSGTELPAAGTGTGAA